MSESNVNAVTKYIGNQEEHHQAHSFQDEFRAFLQKNGIAVDENTFGVSLFRPHRGSHRIVAAPRLTPWAAIWRRFAANVSEANMALGIPARFGSARTPCTSPAPHNFPIGC